MGFDRWNIVLGHYVFYVLWHGGQGSREYARLSRMSRYFTPSPMGIDLSDEPGAMGVYLNLLDRHGYAYDGEPVHT